MYFLRVILIDTDVEAREQRFNVELRGVLEMFIEEGDGLQLKYIMRI